MIRLTQRLTQAAPITATATLDVDTRIKSRVRIQLDDGRDAGLFLERGQLLRGGELLGDESGSEVVQIIAAAEQVSTAHCHDPLLLARACYHLGNRHVPLQIEGDWLRYQHDYVLDDMLRGFGLIVTVEQAPFEPEAGAYQSHAHSAPTHEHRFVLAAGQHAH